MAYIQSDLPPDLNRIRSTNWDSIPEKERRDEVGESISFDQAFCAKTEKDVRTVLDWARDHDFIVKPAGAITSSGSFRHPNAKWMEAHGKRGAVLLEFSKATGSEFKQINVDAERGEVRAGAATTIDEVRERVQYETDGRWVSPMRITTMDARLVATFLGSGGVSDACEDMNSLMSASQWMDGTGKIHEETYERGTYFDWSCFNRVNKGRVGVEMSGRGGPFGVGLHASSRLRRPYMNTNRYVLSFKGGRDRYEVNQDMLTVIFEMNQRAQSMASGLKFKPVGLEIMDEHSIRLAAQNGHRLLSIPEHTQVALIMDLAQAIGPRVQDDDEAVQWCLDNGLLDERLVSNEKDYHFVSLSRSSDVRDAEAFRLAGPDGARKVIKTAFPHSSPLSISTDYSVAAWEKDLILDYGMKLFDAQEEFLRFAERRGSRAYAFGYGHGSWRYDPHVRVVTDDKEALELFRERKLEMGTELVALQKNGRRVRVRGEKPEQPYGEEYKLIAKNRVEAHRASNRALLEELDPDGLFMHRAPERWVEGWQNGGL